MSPDICIHSPGGKSGSLPTSFYVPGPILGVSRCTGKLTLKECTAWWGDTCVPVPWDTRACTTQGQNGGGRGLRRRGMSVHSRGIPGWRVSGARLCFYVSYTPKMALPVRAVFLGSLTVTGKPRSIRWQFSDSDLRLGILLAGWWQWLISVLSLHGSHGF